MATHEITISLDVHEGNGLFLRTGLVSGTKKDGTEVELSLAGGALIFQQREPGKDWITHTLSVGPLLQAWADSLEEVQK